MQANASPSTRDQVVRPNKGEPMSQDSPAIGKSIIAGGVKTNYFDVGSGPPVLLLHGSGIGVTAFANWNRTLPELARAHRAIAFDAAGFGYSDPQEDAAFGLDYWVAHTVAVLDALGVPQTDVIGNSFGGALAIRLTARHPDRVRRVMLMGSAGVEFTVEPVFGAGYSVELSHDVMRSQLQNFTFDPARITDDMVALRLQTALRPLTKARQSRLFPGPREERVTAMCTSVDEIAAINHRFLIVHGRDDVIVPVGTSQTLHGLIKRSDLHVFAECGHWSQIDRADDFNAMAIRFFNGR